MGIQEITIILLAILAGVLSLQTYRTLKTNEKIAATAEKQINALMRPYINIRTFTVPHRAIILLEIINEGKTAARDLSLTVDKTFYQFGQKKEENNLAKLNAFQNVISCFSPGSKLVFNLAHAFTIFNDDADPNLTPDQFIITASYSYQGKQYMEEIPLDLRMHLKSALPPDAIVSELKNIREEIQKIEAKLAQAGYNLPLLQETINSKDMLS